MVGKAGLFSDQLRKAKVEAMSACLLWALRRAGFEEPAARNPALTPEFFRTTAAMMGVRERANFEFGRSVT